jgi:hypothetical protein
LNVGSVLAAGGDLALDAGRDVIGAAGRDILIEGSGIQAERDAILDAGRDLSIIAGKNTASMSMSSISGSAGAGVAAAIGSGGAAYGIRAQAEAAGSRGKSDASTWTNSQVIAGGDLVTRSGRDTTIRGANLFADRVFMDVGGDLTVASLQDSLRAGNSHWSAGGSVTVGYGLSVSAHLGFGEGKTSSDWVGQQTSIIGLSEVDIRTEKNTGLVGAIIATAPGGRLRLDTGTFTWSAIRDRNTGSAFSLGVSGGMNIGGAGFDQDASILGMKPYNFTDTAGGKTTQPFNPPVVELQYASHDMRGVLRPTVTDGTIVVRDNPAQELSGLNRNIDDAREITRDDKVKVDVYASPEAIMEVLSGFKGIREQAASYEEMIEHIMKTFGLSKEEAVAAYQEYQARLPNGMRNADPEAIRLQAAATDAVLTSGYVEQVRGMSEAEKMAEFYRLSYEVGEAKGNNGSTGGLTSLTPYYAELQSKVILLVYGEAYYLKYASYTQQLAAIDAKIATSQGAQKKKAEIERGNTIKYLNAINLYASILSSQFEKEQNALGKGWQDAIMADSAKLAPIIREIESMPPGEVRNNRVITLFTTAAQLAGMPTTNIGMASSDVSLCATGSGGGIIFNTNHVYFAGDQINVEGLFQVFFHEMGHAWKDTAAQSITDPKIRSALSTTMYIDPHIGEDIYRNQPVEVQARLFETIGVGTYIKLLR